MSLYVDAKTAAPDSTRNLQIETLLQEAAQCSGVLRAEVKRERNRKQPISKEGKVLMATVEKDHPQSEEEVTFCVCLATSWLMLTSRHCPPR